MSDLQRVFHANETVARYRAEREAATAKLGLAKTEEAIATLLSRAEPVSGLGMDREHLRVLLAFLSHHDLKRLMREVASMPVAPPLPQPDMMCVATRYHDGLLNDLDALKLEAEHIRTAMGEICALAHALSLSSEDGFNSIVKLARGGLALSAPPFAGHTHTDKNYDTLEAKHESLLNAMFSIVDKTEKLSLIEGSLLSRLRMIAVQAVDADKL